MGMPSSRWLAVNSAGVAGMPSSASGGAGRVVTPNPGHYIEPTFSPDGRTIVFRKVNDGFLTTALWGRDPGVYSVPSAGGEPVAPLQRR